MTLQSPTATLIPLFSSPELTGCGYPGLLDRKNRSDMCPLWESNPGLPACKASTLPLGQVLCSINWSLMISLWLLSFCGHLPEKGCRIALCVLPLLLSFLSPAEGEGYSFLNVRASVRHSVRPSRPSRAITK